MPKLTGIVNPVTKIDSKRFYVPGVIITDTCPGCKKECTLHLDSQPLLYPHVNKPIDVWMYCDDCVHDWAVEVKITLSIALT